MKKRIVALAMCLLLVSAMLFACGETDYEKAKEYTETHSLTPEKEYVTLNLYLPTKGTIDEATVNAMQAEFNSVIEPLYRTRIAFHLVDEASYEETVMAQANLASNNRANGVVDDTTPLLGDSFPKEGASQFDIFVVTGKTMLDSYINLGYVADLTTELTTTYNRKLNDESHPEVAIPSIIYENAVYQVTQKDEYGVTVKDENGNTVTEAHYYGVPANFEIGYYTYYVIDKAFYDMYYAPAGEGVTAAQIIAQLRDKEGYAEKVTVVYGDYRTRYQYDETYVVVVDDAQMPTFTYSELFQGMFCISSLCDYKDRALQVITELYTNTALHSTLQYGAKNVTYTLTEDEAGNTIVSPKEGAPLYSIDTRYTGNVLTLYASTDASLKMDVEHAAYTALQNSEAVYGG